MYRECWVNVDQSMMLAVIVLLLLALAAVAAADRNNTSARKWRKLYQDECASHRRTRLEHSWTAGVPSLRADPE